jgi:hypothetical protein
MRGTSPTAAYAARTHCRNGHPLSGDNLYTTPQGARECRICNREDQQRFRASHPGYHHRWRPPLTAEQQQARKESRQRWHCSRGHELTGDNVFVTAEGYRLCRTCRTLDNARRWRLYVESRPAPRGSKFATHCPQGHPKTPENIYTAPSGYRQCRICRAAQLETQRAKPVDAPRRAHKKKTHCVHGHPLSGENLYVSPKGQRFCRECQRIKDRKRRA